jgi:hypothetical protein
VFGAKADGGGPRVVASFELRRPGGGPVRRSEPTPIEPSPEGRLVRLLAFPLSDQEAGEYELVLRVVDQASGESREVLERLWVVKRG